MTTKNRKRQKQAEKKRQKALARKKALVLNARAGAQLTRDRILHTRDLPVHECLISPDWRDNGMAVVVLSRHLRDGRITGALYLVDLYCLGLKNTFLFPSVSVPEYKAMVRKSFRRYADPPLKCSPEFARALVYGAIDYAAQFGFEPHKDFRTTQYAMEPKDSPTEPIDVTFGYEGKPFFVAGPDDNVWKIIRQLERTTGGAVDETFSVFVPL